MLFRKLLAGSVLALAGLGFQAPAAPTGPNIHLQGPAGSVVFYTGTTRTAASCKQSDVAAQITAAVDLDIVVIPAGDCNTTNQWAGYTSVNKRIKIQGAGGTSTKIGLSTIGGLQITSSDVMVTGIYFVGNYKTTTQNGMIRVGTTAGNPAWHYTDVRIDHNQFDNFGAAGGNVTGNEAISVFGYVAMLIDHNTFNDCNGECVDICMDALPGAARDPSFGLYDTGVVFMEDNTWNVTNAVHYENATDGNSSERFTFRYNTVDMTTLAATGGYITNALVSGHETCATCSGTGAVGDHGTMTYEVYENTIRLGAHGVMQGLSEARAGRGLVYNNHITLTGSVGSQLTGSGLQLSNYRSWNYNGIGFCGQSTYGRLMAAECHEVDGTHPTYTHEGLSSTVTPILNGAITSGATTVTLNSTSGIDTNGVADGYAIRIDNEILQWTGVVGNQLTGVTRGVAGGSAAASHIDASPVKYIILGQCDAQPNNTYVWNNDVNGVVGSTMNDASVEATTFSIIPAYSRLDIQSFATRPNNWQYQTGNTYSYTPYPYPHPLQSRQ